ncbi:maleylpyruvate isomerase N-terminal domain-containing protein [Micromonospora coerulea]|uniref:Maleylpyruvate isomerase N-terminal domain-containing protein n=1 Tax=Micromonospora coerulea TaxID=47856 RepID=A0ABP8SGS1_9ACTN
MNRCDECAFVYASAPAGEVPQLLRGLADRYGAALTEVRDPRRRPAEGVWSPLEYTCHVRDVLRVQGERLALALAVEEPEFVPMGRDERAVADAYNDQDPAVVLAELAAAGDDLAARFAVLGPAELARTGVYSWPQPEVRTLLWLGQHTVHEGVHHLLDIHRAARAQAAAAADPDPVA